jgi:hypothetical protein
VTAVTVAEARLAYLLGAWHTRRPAAAPLLRDRLYLEIESFSVALDNATALHYAGRTPSWRLRQEAIAWS